MSQTALGCWSAWPSIQPPGHSAKLLYVQGEDSCLVLLGGLDHIPKQDLRKEQHNGAALGAAVVQENSTSDPDLTTVINAWPDLPEPVRTGIVAMVQAHKKPENP